MRRTRASIAAEKENYIVRLNRLITSDYNSGVERIRYISDRDDEYAEITYDGGHVVMININRQSCGEIYKDVGQAVYGK